MPTSTATVHFRSSSKSVEIPDNLVTVAELKSFLASHFPVTADRMKLSIIKSSESTTHLETHKSLASYPEFGLSATPLTLLLKDLGPQISWKGVFLIEYAGPIAIALGVFAYRSTDHATQLIPLLCFIAHFIKRELETLLVHRFSNDTMPIANVFKNSGYYWGFALAICWYLLHPLYTAPSPTTRAIGLAIFGVGELINLYTHIKLASLRPAGTRIRQIPRGFLFDSIVCPNYTFEIISWVGFSVATGLFWSWAFAGLSTLILMNWSIAKKKRYQREFDGKDGRLMFPKRWALFPLLW